MANQDLWEPLPSGELAVGLMQVRFPYRAEDGAPTSLFQIHRVVYQDLWEPLPSGELAVGITQVRFPYRAEVARQREI